MPLQAVLFDFDGTLIDSEPVHLAIWRDILADYRITLDLDEYRADYAGNPAPATASLLVARHGLDATAEALAGRKSELSRQCFGARPVALRAHALEAISRCRTAGLGVALVTGSPACEVAPTLAHWGLRERFDVMVTRDDVRCTKPDPESYQLALRRLGLTPGDALAVEDTRHGIASAVAAGLGCVAVPTEYSRDQDLTGAVGRFDGLAPAMDWILRGRPGIARGRR